MADSTSNLVGIGGYVKPGKSGSETNWQLFKNPGAWMSNLMAVDVAKSNASKAAADAKRVQGLLQSKITSGTAQPGTWYNPNENSVVRTTSGQTPASTTQSATITQAPAGGAGVPMGTGAGAGRTQESIKAELATKQAELQKLLTQSAGSQTNNQSGNQNANSTPIGVNPNATLNLQGLIPQLLGNAGANPQVLAAQAEIKKLQDEYALRNAQIGGSRTDLAETGGEQGLLQNLYAGKLNAAQTGLQNAQTEQQIQQGALQNAAGLVAPQAANALGYYEPGTGQFTQYGGGQGGGAASAGAVTQQMNQGATVQNMSALHDVAKKLATNLGAVIDDAKINDVSLGVGTTLASGIRQWIDTKSGDPKYANFANLVSEVAGKYAAILNQAGGTPTDQSQLSHSIINGLASGKDIKTLLESLDKNAGDSIEALKGASGANAYGVGTTGGQTTQSNVIQEGATQSAAGMNWVYRNGKWETSK